MGLFDGFLNKKYKEVRVFKITPDDKKWVDGCFKWLLGLYGYPAKDRGPAVFTAECFPVTFRAKKVNTANLLDDLCPLFGIDRANVSFTMIPDVRDIPNSPHQITGRAFESDLEVHPNEKHKPRYSILVSNSLERSEYLLLRRLILELTKIKLFEKKPDIKLENMQNIPYIAAVFFGYGVLISKALVDIGVSYTAGWQSTWKSKSEVPYQVVAYALACYAKLTEDIEVKWKEELPNDVAEEYDAAAKYLSDNPEENAYFDQEGFESDILARQYHANARKLAKNKLDAEAISEYNKALSFAKDPDISASIYANLGYLYLMREQYDESLKYYNKALEYNPDSSYAYANMGYIYMMLDRMEEAKECLNLVKADDNSLASYLLRDWAIYYMKIGDKEKAKEYFNYAFDTKMQIDLLEYFYAQYLLSVSNQADAKRYAAMSAYKGEKQGMELLKKLEKN